MEQFEQHKSPEGEPRPFIVIDYKNAEEPTVLFDGIASSEEEARDILKKEGIHIDFEKNSHIDIAFEKNDEEDRLAA